MNNLLTTFFLEKKKKKEQKSEHKNHFRKSANLELKFTALNIQRSSD